jgi:ferrochelatase
MTHDALLLLSFGGPEGPDDVLPFLENVTRGRGIPKERLVEVSHHYRALGGVSPINGLNRLLRDRLAEAVAPMPVFWGNRNWHPMLEDTVRQMRDAGVRRALVFATSAFGSYSGCRQYREDLARAQAAVEGAPELDKLRTFFDHPLLIEAWVDAVREASRSLPAPERARLVFTAHSIPCSMAAGGPYESQLRAAAALIAERTGHARWDLAWQSRSGPPTIPWLEPDVGDHVELLKAEGVDAVIVAPIGFLQDHVEVIWDLDHALKERCDALGVALGRARTPGEDPRLVQLVLELVNERSGTARRALSVIGPSPDPCAATCCPAPQRPARP